jgi:rare lipoprotein A
MCALAGAASADPAPIVYARQGGAPVVQPIAQTASLGDGLAGGGSNSYGYGAARPRAGAVIDLRRPSNGAARVAEAAPAPAETPAQAGQGAQPWLERERVGPPYEANGRWYVPTPEPGYSQTGMASWYGPTFHGQRTASGETFDQEALTAAHPTLPIPSLVQVTNLENGREVIVRVNDRGPFVGERLIDLSHGAASVLGFEQAGHAQVHVRYLGPAPRRVNADGSQVPVAPPVAPTPQNGPASLLPPPATEEQLPPPVRQAEQAAPAAGGYFVQVGAFSDLANAHRVRAALQSAGPAAVDVRPTSAGELFRVRLGPWASREEADAARRTLADLGYGEAMIAAR